MGKIEISASRIEAYNACPRLYRYRYVDKIVPKIQDKKLALGTAVHKGLQAYYDGFRDNEHGLQAYNENIGNVQSTADAKDFALGQAMLENYYAWAEENDTFEMVQTEKEFSTLLCRQRNLRFKGRYDGIVKDRFGNYWIKEFKTGKQFPTETVLKLDTQTAFYFIAAQKEMLVYGCNVKGVIYTTIRSTIPKTARTPVIQRNQVVYNNVAAENFITRVLLTASQINEDKHLYPTPGHHCNWRCAYAQLCVSEENGTDTHYLREAFYTCAPSTTTDNSQNNGTV